MLRHIQSSDTLCALAPQISMETLMTLTEQDFIDMGIESLGLCAISEYAQLQEL